MREIKFRGYQEAQGYFVHGCYLNIPQIIEGQVYEHWIVRDDGFKYVIEDKETIGQYTGLKDKNGTEIYEGDILQVPSEYAGSFWPVQVIFENGAFRTQISHMHNSVPLTEARVLTFEIIGNVYENPELLEETPC